MLRRARVALCLVPALVAVAAPAMADDPQQPPPPGNGQPPPPGYGQPPPPGYGQPPPPGYGQPPPGYYPPGYPPPGYPPPGYGQPYYAPQDSRPRYLDYEEDQPIPQGYHLRTKARTGLIGGGAGLLGGTWFVSLMVGLIGDGANNPGDGGWAALYVPVAGPWIAIDTLHSDGTGTPFLVLDGVAQLGGAAMIVLGAVLQEKRLVRDDISKSTVTVTPYVSPRGFGLTGTF